MHLGSIIWQECAAGRRLVAPALRHLLDGRQEQPLIRGRPTVVLLHGMAPHPFLQRLGPASLSGLQHHLQEHGSNALLETYAAGDLRVAGRFLTLGIDALAAGLGEPVQLLGHSTGGLLALAVAQSVPSAVGRVIMVAAPYGGVSITGYFSVARQLIANCKNLQTFYLQFAILANLANV